MPASSAPMSSAKMRKSRSAFGTLPSTMICARPSVMAVLPTPGSPTWMGLFFSLRQSTWMVRWRISSRPMSGSIPPARAFSVRSTV